MNLIKLTSTIAVIGSFCTYSFAVSPIGKKALTYIPKGEIIQEKSDEVKVKTPQGGIIEVEFTRSGQLEEASGNNALTDTFNPPSGLITLAEAVKSLKKAGKIPANEWSLDSSYMKGWIYEFEGYENGQEMEYTVSAKNGDFLKARIDN